jgi:hypothetical protein
MTPVQQSIESTLDRLGERDRLRVKLTPYLLEQGTWTDEIIATLPLAVLRALDRTHEAWEDFHRRLQAFSDALDADVVLGYKGCPGDEDAERDSAMSERQFRGVAGIGCHDDFDPADLLPDPDGDNYRDESWD